MFSRVGQAVPDVLNERLFCKSEMLILGPDFMRGSLSPFVTA